MRLAVTHRLIDRVDPEPIRALIERELAPYFDGPDRPIWPIIADRMRWVGVERRPPDVAFRRMRPQAYAQLCLINDEDPYSPWALAVPEGLSEAALAELDALITAPLTRLCQRHYGEGVLYFCVLAILGPGGVIPRHRDMMHDPDKKAWSHHLHVPITHARDTFFTVARSHFTMEPGGVYEINNMKPHSVINRGDGFRVNVMLDYCPDANLARRGGGSPLADPHQARR